MDTDYGYGDRYGIPIWNTENGYGIQIRTKRYGNGYGCGHAYGDASHMPYAIQ